MKHELHHQRREYDAPPLSDDGMLEEPFAQFEHWYQAAVAADVLEPNAMVLSTVDIHGKPSQRTVLLKYFDRDGFVFFTNYGSRKAKQIGENANVSALFVWLSLHRQVEISGRAEKVSTAESLKYFTMRPRGSQLGAWVSQQSSVISSRSILDAKLTELKEKFANRDISWPSFWGGFRIVPDRFEFWQGQPSRLHDRFEYLVQQDGTWHRRRLAP